MNIINHAIIGYSCILQTPVLSWNLIQKQSFPNLLLFLITASKHLVHACRSSHEKYDPEMAMYVLAFVKKFLWPKG